MKLLLVKLRLRQCPNKIYLKGLFFLFCIIFLSNGGSIQNVQLNIDSSQSSLSLHRTLLKNLISNSLLPLEDRIVKLESLASLETRIQNLEISKENTKSHWWNTPPSSVIISSSFITAIITGFLAFLKWILDRSKFKHEQSLSVSKFQHKQKLSLIEIQSKVRNDYFVKVLDTNLDLERKLAILRFLKNTNKEDPVLAKSANEYLEIIQQVRAKRLTYYDKSGDLATKQGSLPTINDMQLKKQVLTEIEKLEQEMKKIKTELFLDGFTP